MRVLFRFRAYQAMQLLLAIYENGFIRNFIIDGPFQIKTNEAGAKETPPTDLENQTKE